MATAKKRAPKQKRALGTGLSALMGGTVSTKAPAKAVAKSAAPTGTTQAQTLPIEMLHANPSQPRTKFSDENLKELANSIKVSGVLQSILVRPSPSKKGEYEIIAGERRWRAAQIAALHEVPVTIRELDDTAVLQVALVENLQRADLNPVEEARGYQRLIDDYGHTANEVARVVGKSRPHVANSIRLLNLPKPVLAFLESGELAPGHVRPLIGLPDATAKAKQMVKEGLTARDAERMGRSRSGKRKSSAAAPTKKTADTVELESSLAAALGNPVTITDRGGSGEVRIVFKTYDALDKIISNIVGDSFK